MPPFSVSVKPSATKQLTAQELAIEHWNNTPLFLAEEERYSIYPWLYEVAEFRKHRGHSVLEVGCGTGCDLLQFAKHGAHAFGIDVTPEHIRLARQRLGTTGRYFLEMPQRFLLPRQLLTTSTLMVFCTIATNRKRSCRRLSACFARGAGSMCMYTP